MRNFLTLGLLVAAFSLNAQYFEGRDPQYETSTESFLKTPLSSVAVVRYDSPEFRDSLLVFRTGKRICGQGAILKLNLKDGRTIPFTQAGIRCVKYDAAKGNLAAIVPLREVLKAANLSDIASYSIGGLTVPLEFKEANENLPVLVSLSGKG